MEVSRSRLIGFITIAAGFSVANLYYVQPLGERIARELGTDAGGMSPVLAGTQLGYAAGMVLLAPLCDVRERRSTIVSTALGCAIALIAFAVAPSVAAMTVASVAIGMGASVTQMLLPFAVGLGTPAERGKIVGTVMGGVLAGILLSRALAGSLGEVIGWRGVFVAAACAMVVLAIVLRVLLPISPATTTLPYRALLSSMWKILKRERVLRRRTVIGAVGFAAFSVFWSTIAFQCKAAGLGGSGVAGGLGILGLTGVVVAPIVGRAAMRITPTKINILALAVIAVSFVVFWLGGASLIWIGVGVVLMDGGAQANHLTNQTVIFGLSPEERSRVNSIYMVGYFLGGALGTAIAAQAWQHGGWPAVCAAGGIAAILAIPALPKSV
ncbi:MAG: MFS transporter [Kofleriaceae bacterium]